MNNGQMGLGYLKTRHEEVIETISNPQQSWGDSRTQGAINVVSN